VEQLQRPESPPANQEQFLAASIQPIVAFMVICSIAVHGLSIPFFSLGRRVHSLRTWSRHPTQDTNGPEWANQMRHVRQGEDIVINRDDNALERGECSPDADEKRSATTTLNQAQHVPKEKDMAESPTESEKRASTAGPRGEAETGDQGTPDGDEVLQEWKEGPHRVIERRAGAGEEVKANHIRALDWLLSILHRSRLKSKRTRSWTKKRR
jgi:sodium/hydrogen antiporter